QTGSDTGHLVRGRVAGRRGGHERPSSEIPHQHCRDRFGNEESAGPARSSGYERKAAPAMRTNEMTNGGSVRVEVGNLYARVVPGDVALSLLAGELTCTATEFVAGGPLGYRRL